MAKGALILFFLLGVFSLMGGGALRIADASRSGINALNAAALSFSLENKTAVTIDRVTPEEARKRLAAGRADLIVLEHGNLPSRRPAVCRLFAAEVLAVYVHSSNPVKNLTRKELKEVLTDKRPAWTAYYPLRKTDIHRYILSDRAHGYRLAESLLGVEHLAPDMFAVNSSRELLLLAGSDAESMAIGLLMPDLPPEVRTLRINGVLPVPRDISSGKYLLCWRYYIVSSDKKSGNAVKFLEKMKLPSFFKELESFGFMAL